MDLATLKRSESISAPLLTVIIPAYNVETYLEQCLASILAQESEQIEVLAINDGSTDRTLDILRKIARCDNRIIIVDKPNGGYGSAVNQGLDRASGLYVSIIEPDDFIEGAMHEELLEAAFSYGLPDIIKTPFLRINPIDQYSTALKCGFWNRVKPRTNPFTIAEAPLLMRYHPSIWSAIYRTEFLRNEGIRFDELPGGGWVDNPFMVETLCSAKSILYVNKAFYRYREERVGSSSASLADFRMPINRWNKMTDYLSTHGINDEEILGIHYYRGFHYLDDAKSAANYCEDEWADAARNSLMRMRPDIVARSRYVSPSDKNLYKTLTLHSLPPETNMPYYRMLAAETYWEIKNNGIGQAFRKAKVLQTSKSV